MSYDGIVAEEQLKRIADAVERIADVLDRAHPDPSVRPEPPEGMTWDDVRTIFANPPTRTEPTKGRYRWTRG